MYPNLFPKSLHFRGLLQVGCRRELSRGSLVPSINPMLHELPCSLHCSRFLSVCREELKTSSSRTLTTRDLITPFTDAAFKRLFSDPALLKGFLNSIFDKEGFSIEEIKQTVNLACFTPGSQEPAYAATQEVASRQQSPGSPVIDPKYLPSENAGDDRAGLSVRSRLVTASSGWAGKKEHWNNSAKLDPASSPQQPQPPTLRNYRCNPVYVISICDFPWKKLGIPERLQSEWLLWLGPHWDLGKCSNVLSNKLGDKSSIPQERPIHSYIFISLPIFKSALGDRVDATLEKLVWILANTGQHSRDRLVPEWTETDPTAKLFIDKLRYASLTPVERRFYNKQEGLEQSYWAAIKHQIEEGLATERERSRQITEQLAAEQERQRQKEKVSAEQLAAKQERHCQMMERIRQRLRSEGVDPSILDK
ncbi:hypothetical protein Pst134EA_025939 [Puccinia striiformis f. sp. tritici]|uniref:hypothetical protein n=1 Tax=Puccinia striiformis f. sp. tritici TaxID=168172 RepID=UPI0020078B5E|nr:hypothetical protein Pst134EA_025939 [Puccinia striiformis f. sp. tritici]KAH9452002.1 hypothetical protein Pst134EA_025939 [Puccinia striiformis f. sp. tritici]